MANPFSVEIPWLGTRFNLNYFRDSEIVGAYQKYESSGWPDLWYRNGRLHAKESASKYHVVRGLVGARTDRRGVDKQPVKENGVWHSTKDSTGIVIIDGTDDGDHTWFTFPCWIRADTGSQTINTPHEEALDSLITFYWEPIDFRAVRWNAPRKITAVEVNYQMPEIAWNAPAEAELNNLEMPGIDWYVPDFKNLEMPAIAWNARDETLVNYQMPPILWNADQVTLENLEMPAISWYLPVIENLEMPEIVWGGRDETLYNLQMPRIEWNAGRPLATGLADEYLLCGRWPPEILRVSDAVNIGRRDQYWTCGIIWNIPLTDVWEMPGIEWNAPSVLERIERGYYND